MMQCGSRNQKACCKAYTATAADSASVRDLPATSSLVSSPRAAAMRPRLQRLTCHRLLLTPPAGWSSGLDCPGVQEWSGVLDCPGVPSVLGQLARGSSASLADCSKAPDTSALLVHTGRQP